MAFTNRFKEYALLATIIISASCSMATPTADDGPIGPPLDRSGYSVIPAEFHGVNFKERQPSIGENLHSALADSERSLDHDLKLILTYPSTIELRVLGFTDTNECSGLECKELSLRRAQLLHDWLIDHGVPPSRLEAPYGYGSARPIGDNETVTGRAKNRRAYISEEGDP